MSNIMGIRVNKSEFKMLQFIITSERQAGWKPSKLDVLHLIKRGRQPADKLKQDMSDFDKAMDKSYQINSKGSCKFN